MTPGNTQIGATTMTREILTFALDDQRYALPSSLVHELARAVTIISFPCASKRVEGVIDLHGRIVPVIDLRQHLGLTPRATQPGDHLIIFRSRDRLFAIRVDRVIDVCSFEPSKGEESLAISSSGAIVQIHDGTVMVLDLARLATGLGEPDPQSGIEQSRWSERGIDERA